jgi:hypothetical protein
VELPQGRGSGRWLVWLRRSLKNQAEPSFDSSSTSHCPPHTDRTARLNQRSVVERCTLRAPVVVADDAARLGSVLVHLHARHACARLESCTYHGHACCGSACYYGSACYGCTGHGSAWLWLCLPGLGLPWPYLHARVREARELSLRLLDVETVGEGVDVPG